MNVRESVRGSLLGAIALWVSAAAVLAAELAPGAAILQELKSFNTLGTVLHVAAHPDDENTQLITYFARARGYRMGYLSVTRGDGGQNEIGPEFDEKLGVARTQELLAARRLDGGRQFFTRAIDFGFSKNAEETLAFWDRQQVLGDVVRVIRRFRPDVIVTRFDPGSSGMTHGHHTSSGILGLEAFKLAGDPKAFPEQLTQGLTVWQPKRVVLNAGGGGGRGGTPAPVPAGAIRVDIGGNDPVTGESLAAIATAHALGVSVRKAVQSLAVAPAVPGRLQAIVAQKPFRVFVDYAHSDDALTNVLRTLRELNPARIIVVFGCGGNRDRAKRPKMAAAVDALADHAIVTSDNPRKEDPIAIIEDIKPGFRRLRPDCVPDRKEAIYHAIAMAQPRDIILLAGKGHETYQEFADSTVPFDDAAIAASALSSRSEIEPPPPRLPRENREERRP